MARGFSVFLLPIVLVAFLWGCNGNSYSNDNATSTPRPGSATQTDASPAGGGSLIAVQVADNSFSPANLTVPKGTKVTWNWTGRNSHSVTGSFAGTSVESSVQKSGSFAFTFDKPGTFDYQCGVHGAAMTAKVTVKE